MSKPARNESCPCGSGLKHKRCCGAPGLASVPQVRAGSSVAAHAEAAFQSGLVAQQAGNAAKARRYFAEAVQLASGNATYRNALGNILKEQGKLTESLACYEQALGIDPLHAMAHYNRGDALLAQGRCAEAIAAFKCAIEIDPQFCQAHLNLGNAYLDDGQPDEAINSYRQAVAVDQTYATAHLNLGIALRAQGKLDEAIASYRTAAEAAPSLPVAHLNLGNALLERGDREAALKSFAKVLALDPRHPTARHLHAFLSGTQSDRAPAGYVTELFDSYAAKFDDHLVNVLGYDTPDRLVDSLVSISAPVDNAWDILDLGCGTGLLGARLARYARTMVGVDLSGKMLEIARSGRRYHRLEQADLVPMMRAEPPASFDVVVAGDVFVYLGQLDNIVAQVRRLLRPGGMFAFSVEALEAFDMPATQTAATDYRLTPTGRYAHSAGYLRQLADRHGFVHGSLERSNLRMEQGKPVEAWLALWKV